MILPGHLVSPKNGSFRIPMYGEPNAWGEGSSSYFHYGLCVGFQVWSSPGGGFTAEFMLVLDSCTARVGWVYADELAAGWSGRRA